jgi:hypothetical protein
LLRLSTIAFDLSDLSSARFSLASLLSSSSLIRNSLSHARNRLNLIRNRYQRRVQSALRQMANRSRKSVVFIVTAQPSLTPAMLKAGYNTHNTGRCQGHRPQHRISSRQSWTGPCTTAYHSWPPGGTARSDIRASPIHQVTHTEISRPRVLPEGAGPSDLEHETRLQRAAFQVASCSHTFVIGCVTMSRPLRSRKSSPLEWMLDRGDLVKWRPNS